MTAQTPHPPKPAHERCHQCEGRGLIHWHPYWDNGYDTCKACEGRGFRLEGGSKRRDEGGFNGSFAAC